ncbi:C4-dicarboxylate transporter, substrate-binding protein [Deferribacter desulfuricans SSM1]|uniref:C4-dicarboxylate transporter, substrate-binding protein n=1 Tax=Deferribacter desulfuricans (strain DSM 14783 / JCM 11476 / NBRC 101012 / SSM1) TaxID=639282 RepID=D3PC39_DEFDS|nr:TRAP transporter substrate-binding protein [Deferribacter desulfuricans]BAI80162.1 C4-dicarboxylate transporter, substrate-binding protein [Deferribacter desulfuricans SSM1]
MKLLRNMMFLMVAFSLLVVPAMAKPIKVKFSHVVAVETPKGKAAEYLKKLLEERTNGKIKMEVYPNASLYGDREAVEALKMNAIQLACPSFSKFTGFVPQLQLFDLPFLFDSTEHLHKFMDSEWGKKILKLVGSKGLVGLAYWDNGFKVLSNNIRPIILPKDAKGIKFRIMSSKVLEEQFKVIGAIPHVLPFSEVYSALQQGVVDGAENPWSNFYTKKFYEVQKYLTVSYHGYLGYMLVTNKIFMKKLKKAGLDKVFLDSVKEATEYERKLAKELDEYYYNKVKEYGKIQIHVTTPEERKIWKKTMMQIYPKFYDVIGKEFIDAALNTK